MRMIIDMIIYLIARLLLVVALTLLISGTGYLFIGDLPLGVALLFAIILALPLGIWFFTPLRKRVTKSIKLIQ